MNLENIKFYYVNQKQEDKYPTVEWSSVEIRKVGRWLINTRFDKCALCECVKYHIEPLLICNINMC